MTTNSDPGRRGADLLSVERLLSLSDNVVAFALTLLVLQVTVPSLSQVADPTSAADLAAQLARQAGHLVSYVIAFYIIAQFWLTHRRVFRHVAGHRDSLAWWNFAFLATITVMPFTSSLLGAYPSNPLAVDIFAANLLLAVVATRVTFMLGRRWDLLAGETALELIIGLALIIVDIQAAVRGRFLGHSLTAPQIRPLIITVWIVFGLAAVCLWLRMARANGQGRNWARIVSTVLFALATLQLRGAFTQPPSHAGFGATVMYYGATVVFVAAWLVGAAAVWLLWRPASSAFFKPQGFTQALPRHL